jgi:hypothetical protein
MGIAVWPAASSLQGEAIGRWRGKRGGRGGKFRAFELGRWSEAWKRVAETVQGFFHDSDDRFPPGARQRRL